MNIRNALGTAIAANDAEDVSRLIRTGADIGIKGEQGGSMLHLAAMADADRVIPVLVKAGLDVNAPAIDGTVPLHMAALLGNLAAADALDRRRGQCQRNIAVQRRHAAPGGGGGDRKC